MNDDLIITLRINGRLTRVQILTTFSEKTRDYIALIPMDGGGDEGSILIYRYKETITDGEEGIELFEILSDMEFDTAALRFEEVMMEGG